MMTIKFDTDFSLNVFDLFLLSKNMSYMYFMNYFEVHYVTMSIQGEMGEARIFLNTPSFYMDIMRRI